LACFWLLVGVVLPLLDVVDRATHIELVVKIEEPTAQEKLEDDFRGRSISPATTVLLMLEDGKKEVLYIDNKPVEIRRRKAEVSGVYVELGDERIESIVCDLARPDPMSKEVLSVKPVEIVRGEQRWLVNGELLPPGENFLLVERFIGLANFFDYFGLKGISQGRTFVRWVIFTVRYSHWVFRLDVDPTHGAVQPEWYAHHCHLIGTGLSGFQVYRVSDTIHGSFGPGTIGLEQFARGPLYDRHLS
jgi:hypothetical protein